ncbi:MAG: FKBP-type peptidyl-prolyl cis-trans isomerase [Bacteroidales bacterium]|jgi:FKBP-type peptidyl-prolyl cis-trans isomerase|nr:FKBP-type peptidyl-prolyl cis-trans isomerase [Bacteroidales bacterium]
MRNWRFRSVLFTVVLVAAGLAVTSCFKLESSYEEQKKLDDKILTKYLADNNIEAKRHSSGFYYEQLLTIDHNPGTELMKNDVVSFYYTISTLNGTVIETNEQPGIEPARFKLLTRTIIPEALDYGIKMMKTGQRFKFYIPSYLAFGSYRSEHFPANSNFVVEIKVAGVNSEFEIESMQRDSIINYASAHYGNNVMYRNGLCFVDSIPGTGNSPMQGDRVTIDFKRKYLDNSLIRSTEDVTFFLNSGNAVEGLEQGLMLMKRDGEAILLMPSVLAFKQSLCVIPEKSRKELLRDRLITSDVLPYSILKYVVKLKNVN